MPLKIDSILFADEFNSGTTTSLGALVGDKITITGSFHYENYYDASLDSNYKISGVNSNTILGAVSGKQAFKLTNDLWYANPYNRSELVAGMQITVSNMGALNGTYTILDIDNASKSIITTTAYSTTINNDVDALIYVSTAFNQFELRTALADNPDGMLPTYPSNSNQGYYTNAVSVGMGATALNYLNNGSWRNGSFTITGNGTGSRGEQQYTFTQVIYLLPISTFTNLSSGGLIDNSPLNEVETYNITKNLIYLFEPYLRYGSIDVTTVTQEEQQYPLIKAKMFDSGLDSLGFTVASNYTLNNLAIVRTSDSEATDKPLRAAKFTISYDIENATDTPFSNGNTKIKSAIEIIPTTYEGNLGDYEDVALWDRALTTLGAGAVSGVATGDSTSITNYVTTFNSTSSITISFDVEFTSGAQSILDNDSRITIWSEVQNHTLNYITSDRVNVLAYFGTSINNILANPVNIEQTKFITAPFTTIADGIDNDEVDGFPVQLLVANTRFYINWANRDDLRLNTISQNLVLKNSSTLEEIELDITSIPVNSFTLIGGTYPSINYSTQKGFKIPLTEIRNLITCSNDFASDFDDVHYFTLSFPFFIRWEYYNQLILNTIPASIIDSGEDFNGVNYDLYRIDSLANWSLYYRVTFDSEEGGQEFTQEFDYLINTTDYNSHPDVTSRTIKSYSEDGLTELTSGGEKFIESTEKTLIEAQWTVSTPPATTDDFEIEIYIEAFENGSPTKIQRISSTNNLLGSSWFTDTGAGNGRVAKSIVSNKPTGKVFIDNTKLALYDYYNVYATLYTPPLPTFYLVAENGDNFITENSENLIIE